MYGKVHCKEWTNSYFYSQFESYVSSTCILSMLFWNVTWIWKCTWTWLMFNEKERISKIPKFSFSRFYHFGILWWIIHDGLVSQIHLGLYISLISIGILGRLPNSYGQILFVLKNLPVVITNCVIHQGWICIIKSDIWLHTRLFNVIDS